MPRAALWPRIHFEELTKMATSTVRTPTLSTVLINRWQQVGKKFESLAEAFPEKKYDSKPVDATRTVAEVLRHVAFWNHFVADSARGKKADDSGNELPAAKYSTKAHIVDALKQSSAEVVSALEENHHALEPQTAELIVTFLEHTSEHYGQLVVYARMNGIVPPASRS
jgi:uncharacterized damage-inducible protein DinB